MAEEEITVTLTVQVRTFDTPARAKHRVSEETLRRLALAFSDVQITEAHAGTSYVSVPITFDVERILRSP